MADPPVTPEIHQSLDIHRNFPAQIAFGNTVRDFTTERIKLGIGQITNGHLRTDPGRIAYLECARPADTVDVRQRDPDMLPIGDIDPGDTCHSGLLSLLGQEPTRVAGTPASLSPASACVAHPCK